MFLVINLYNHKIISCSSWKISLIYCTLFRDYMLSKKKNPKNNKNKQNGCHYCIISDIFFFPIGRGQFLLMFCTLFWEYMISKKTNKMAVAIVYIISEVLCFLIGREKFGKLVCFEEIRDFCNHFTSINYSYTWSFKDIWEENLANLRGRLFLCMNSSKVYHTYLQSQINFSRHHLMVVLTN